MFTFPWFRETVCNLTPAGTSETRDQNLCHGKNKEKSKSILIQAWTGPEGSKGLTLPDFKTIGA
jgi:hypothetical protein